MDDRFKAYLENMTRVGRFGRTYANYFVRTSWAGQLFAIVAASVDEIDRLKWKQRRSIVLTPRPLILIRAVTKEMLIRAMDAIEMTARAIAMHIPIAEDKFRSPWTYNYEEVLLTARAFAEDAAPLRDEFLKYCMPPTFIEDLIALTGELEEAIAARNEDPGARLCVEAKIDDAMERALMAVRELDVMMHNRFDDDELGRTEWIFTNYVKYEYRPNSAPGSND